MENSGIEVKQLPMCLARPQVQQLWRELLPLLKQDRPQIVFDLSDLKTFDSAGVDFMRKILCMVLQRDGSLKIEGASAEGRHMLEMTRLENSFQMPAPEKDGDWKISPRRAACWLVAAGLFLGSLSDSAWGAQTPTPVPMQSEQTAAPVAAKRPAAQSTPSQEELPAAPSATPPTQAPNSEQKSQPVQAPVGTAASPIQPRTAVVGATPGGAALAPRAQRRSRSLWVKWGLIAGAGIAVGTIAALSMGTASKPPGAH